MNQLKNDDVPAVRKPSNLRRVFSQVLAVTMQNLLPFDMGLCIAMPIIIIGNLDSDKSLSISPSDASWIGSIAYVSLLFGGAISSITDKLGRRLSMILVNIPFLAGWFILYSSYEVSHILLALAVLGMAIGLMEPSMTCYVGEICEPEIREILVSYTFFPNQFGTFLALLLNNFLPWRTVALISFTVPLITAALIYLIPETPHFLLSKNRINEARKSLCWLRGWAPSEVVAEEFEQLQRYMERSKWCQSCLKQDIKCVHPLPTFCENLVELKRRKALKPVFIILSLTFFTIFTGATAMRPYQLQIFKAYESPLGPDESATITSFIINLASLIFMCSVKFIGKRKLYLMMGFGIFLSSFIISCYAFIYLPSGFNSFDQQSVPFHLEKENIKSTSLKYIPLICLFCWNFCSNCGFLSMPWIMLASLLPFKIRGTANGILATIHYAASFILIKTYYNLEETLSLAGTSLFHCIICGIGLILMYFIFPNTDNLTLEDIERHFANNSLKITDWKIAKSVPMTKDLDLEHNEILKNLAQRKVFEEEKLLVK